MKNLILSIITLVTLTSFIAIDKVQSNNQKTTSEVSSVECKYSQCTAIAASTGKTCKHCVSNEGDLYCWQHK